MFRSAGNLQVQRCRNRDLRSLFCSTKKTEETGDVGEVFLFLVVRPDVGFHGKLVSLRVTTNQVGALRRRLSAHAQTDGIASLQNLQWLESTSNVSKSGAGEQCLKLLLS